MFLGQTERATPPRLRGVQVLRLMTAAGVVGGPCDCGAHPRILMLYVAVWDCWILVPVRLLPGGDAAQARLY